MIAQVEPAVRQYAPTGEMQRQLPPPAVNALIDAGLFRTWVPRAYGGLEMDPIPSLQLFEELARIDGSAGGVVSNSSFLAFMAQALPDEGSAEMFADPRTVSWQVPFGSACHFADWLGAPCLIMDGEAPRLGPDGNPLLLLAFFRRDEAEPARRGLGEPI